MHIQLNEQNQYLRTLPAGNIEFSPTVFQPAHTLTPEQAEQFRVHPLTPTEAPTYDPITHGVRAAAPVKVDNDWHQAWEVYPLPAEDVEANQAAAAQALQQSIVDATQQRLDDFASTRNYDGILSACTYATSAVPKFAAEGQYAVQARDSTWAALYSFLADVQAGTQPVPSGFEDVEPLLPPLAWPI